MAAETVTTGKTPTMFETPLENAVLVTLAYVLVRRVRRDPPLTVERLVSIFALFYGMLVAVYLGKLYFEIE